MQSVRSKGNSWTSSRMEAPSPVQVLRLVQSLLRDGPPRDSDIELWDGTRWIGDTQAVPSFYLRLCNPDIIVLRSPNRRMALGEAYIRRKLRYHRRPRSRVPPRLISKE